ncbi:MAG TPA: N-acetylmuramoyl-L-alanine amidase [Thermomicrobiales bacterium]|nr:N-acetylmuramoyl-L-alanine amidase [Thermomicrobiales bacterium]
MNHRNLMIAAIALAALSVLLLATVVAWQRNTTYPVEGRIVVLDPGHFESRADTGAVNLIGGVRLLERDVNWEVALATRRILIEQGIIVVLTRQEGEYVSRPARYRIAGESRGEVLVSIHHNGADDQRINYTSTFYTHESDIAIARRAQTQLARALGFQDGGIRPETFGMTVHSTMPAALTEAWFITHDGTATRYLAERAARASDAPGLGWPADSLVELEARALSAAITDFLQATRPPGDS